jgi:hypothetical protein
MQLRPAMPKKFSTWYSQSDTNPEPERISVIRAIAAFTAEFEEHTAPEHPTEL